VILKKIITIFSNYQSIFSNIFSLTVLQVFNYILPIISIPYLVRVLGPEYFGLLAFATSIMAIFTLIIDYGFDFSATQQISLNRKKKKIVNQIFSSVIIIKVILSLICLIFLIFILIFFEKFNSTWEVYILSFGAVITQIFFPVWLFQGIEKMKYIMVGGIISKSFFTFLIFIFVKEQSDYLVVPTLIMFGSLASAIWALTIIFFKLNFKFSWQNYDKIKIQFINGWYIFFSNLSVSLYTIITTVILGLLTNNTTVGYFSAVKKIIDALKGLYNPLSQAIFPYMGRMLGEKKNDGIKFAKNFSKFVIPFMFMVSFCLFLFSEELIKIFLGSQFLKANILLKIMSPLPFIITISNIGGIQVLFNLGIKKILAKIFLSAGLLSVILNYILISNYQAIGSATAVLVIEIYVSLVIVYYVNKLALKKKIK